MRVRWTATVCLLATSLAALGTQPAPAAEAFGMMRKTYIVKTRVGKIYVEVVHPTKNGKVVKAPGLFTYSPYWMLGANPDEPGSFRRASDAAEWVPHGYARVWADVVGTGNSGGCYDYGGDREKKSAYDLVEWIARQKWSTGKVGMFGGSYEGTTATAAAVMDPPHLTTIVPEAAISRWYGYAYSGGMRYFLNNEQPADEGFDTPLLFDAGLAVPPPVDAQGEDWAGRFQENVTPCDEITHIEHGYDDTPDYNKFWAERDYLKDADKIDIPVMVAHNWGDWNVKQEEGWNLFHALKNAPQKAMFFGNRYLGHGTPEGSYDKTLHAWMNHHLKGVDNDTPNLPKIISETSNYDGALKYLSAPVNFKTKDVALTLQEIPPTKDGDYSWMLTTEPKPQTNEFSTAATFLAVGINTESHSNHHMKDNHDWIWFQTDMLTRDVRVFGEIKVKLRVSSPEREWITITPGIVDVDMRCHEKLVGQHYTKPDCLPRSMHSVTRGFLDSRYRNGLGKPSLVKPGDPIDLTIEEKPIDYVFEKGHHIGLNISTEILEWALPKHYPCTSQACTRVRVHWEEGASKLILPVVGAPADPASLFHMH